MRDLLQHIPYRVNLLWQGGSIKRLAKLGGFLSIVFVLIAGTNLVFGSRDGARATSSQLPRDNKLLDQTNLPFEFQFIGQGRITGGSDDKWMIGNLPIHVGKQTQLNNDLHPGDYVTLSGRILQNEVWLADRIELTQVGESFFTFNSPLKWVQGIVWRIGGHTLLTDIRTKIGGNLIINDFLLTTFTVLENGVWLALEIKAFDQFPIEPTPIAPATPTQLPNPTNAQTRTEVTSPNPGSISKPSDGKRENKEKPSNSKKKSNSKAKGKAKGHTKNRKK